MKKAPRAFANNGVPQILLFSEVTNMALAHDRLRELVKKHVVAQEALVLFHNRKANRIKMLFWDGTGWAIWYKRLDGRKVNWPAIRKGQHTVQIGAEELAVLIHGYDYGKASLRVSMAKELRQEQNLMPKWPRLKEELKA